MDAALDASSYLLSTTSFGITINANTASELSKAYNMFLGNADGIESSLSTPLLAKFFLLFQSVSARYFSSFKNVRYCLSVKQHLSFPPN